jgi:uridine kinase
VKTIYLIVGTPGSGKTWVCNQLKEQFDYLPHDDFDNDVQYVSAIARFAGIATKPILIETPFSVTQVMEPLIKRRFIVIPVFIIESEQVTTQRYEARENKPIPKGHLTRIETYIDRANKLNAFQGTSQQVLDYLKAKV